MKSWGRLACRVWAWPLACAWLASAVQAQGLPAGCSAADAGRAEVYSQAIVGKLLDSDLEAYARLVVEFERGLSKPCRAALERMQPERRRCNAQERKQVVDSFAAQFALAAAGDLLGMFDASQALEQAISRSCWLAVNQPVQPMVRQACSHAELDQIAAHSGPLREATRVMLSSLDIEPYLGVVQSMFASVSPSCRQGMQSAVQQSARQPSPGAASTNPRIHDHGHGTLSVPGVGACTPSGCMSF